jgi:hypothetical protein
MHISWNIGGNFFFKMFQHPIGVDDFRFSIIRCTILVVTSLIITILFGPTRLTRQQGMNFADLLDPQSPPFRKCSADDREAQGTTY